MRGWRAEEQRAKREGQTTDNGPRDRLKPARRNSLPKCATQNRNPSMGLIILIVVILLLLGSFPTGGYGYGYRSHGIIGTILIIVLILWLLGRL